MTPSTSTQYTLEDWRRIAGIRQGVVNKLEKRIKRLEAENIALRTANA